MSKFEEEFEHVERLIIEQCRELALICGRVEMGHSLAFDPINNKLGVWVGYNDMKMPNDQLKDRWVAALKNLPKLFDEYVLKGRQAVQKLIGVEKKKLNLVEQLRALGEIGERLTPAVEKKIDSIIRLAKEIDKLFTKVERVKIRLEEHRRNFRIPKKPGDEEKYMRKQQAELAGIEDKIFRKVSQIYDSEKWAEHEVNKSHILSQIRGDWIDSNPEVKSLEQIKGEVLEIAQKLHYLFADDSGLGNSEGANFLMGMMNLKYFDTPKKKSKGISVMKNAYDGAGDRMIKFGAAIQHMALLLFSDVEKDQTLSSHLMGYDNQTRKMQKLKRVANESHVLAQETIELGQELKDHAKQASPDFKAELAVAKKYSKRMKLIGRSGQQILEKLYSKKRGKEVFSL